ncbi:AAA family ATPase [Tissierella praeacuta]|uniref:ATP-binding protein n=1 Tax=Tissierella praeacuta TaxID=43131 RepID=UPI003341E765
MLLKELNLIGFGKFKNRSIILKDGINLIYGENEAGKSTLHNFINGMFYGFLKPNVKSTLYLEEYEKYNPWDKSKYAGIIRFEYNGKIYRIERDFTKGEESTKVLEETTGEDITRSIDNGLGRVLQPGIHFFGFNTRVFSNTISIKQLETKTDDKLANEVKEKLINVSTALDDTISIDWALSELKIRMMEIGTDRAPTKPYAKNLREIEELQYKKKNIFLERDNYRAYLEEKIRLNNNLDVEIKKITSLKEKLLNVEALEKYKTLEEARILSDEIANLEIKIEKLSSYANISMNQYKECINLNNSIDFIDKAIVENKLELENIENKLKAITEKDSDGYDEKKFQEIIKDYNSYEEVEEEKSKILYKKENNKLEFLNRDFKGYGYKISRYKILQGFMIILSMIIIIIGVVLNRYLIFGLSIPFIGLFICSYIKAKNIKLNIKGIKYEIDTIYNHEKENQIRIEEIEKFQKGLLEKYNVVNKLELKGLLDTLQIKTYTKKEQIDLYKELNIRKKSLIYKINENEFNKKEIIVKLEQIFRENNVKNIEEFSQGIDRHALLEKCMKEVDGKKEVLRRVLGQNTIDDLIAELDGFHLDMGNFIFDMNKNQIKYQIDRVNESILDIRIALKGAEENLNILGKNIDKLVEIEEELDRKMKYKDILQNKYSSLELAVNTIEELSKDIHSQFAPFINKKVSNIVERITGGKYNNIKISESLNISVENPITKEIIELNSLSGGTIDQLYFSLRFGIINSMGSNKFPLILDDCFIQYDDKRLENMIGFLVDICKERQIILFTCHNREKKTLEKLGVEFNLINLS